MISLTVMTRERVVFAIMLVGMVALIAPARSAQTKSGAIVPVEMSVMTTGSLPGVRSDQLPDLFADALNAATEQWHFKPFRTGSSYPTNRIELSVQANPNAAGTVRNYGFPRPMIERRLNIHHPVTIEARVFRNGQCLTKASQTAMLSGSGHRARLDHAIAELTRAIAQNLGRSS